MTEGALGAVRAALAEGDLDSAERHARAALGDADHDPLMHAYLGSILLRQDKSDDALVHFGRAVAMRPGSPELRNELGNALAVTGALDAAEEQLRGAVRLGPDIPQVHNNLGNVLRAAGRHTEAADSYQKAIELKPDYGEAFANLGVVLQEAGDLDGAARCYREALAIDPGAALAMTHLGTIMAAQGRLAEAEAAHRAALEAAPGLHGALNNLGIVLKDQGRLAEAVMAYRTALQLRPGDASIHSNLLMALCYDPKQNESGLYAAHRAYGERQELADEPSFEGDFDPERKLRIGYVSPDFYSHSVASFVVPVLCHHDKSRFHVTCYSDLVEGDAVTGRLREYSDSWRDTVGLTAPVLTAAIRADAIDILVDLAGHTANNRLPVFAGRAAPVQVTWIGYPATTGLERMDWRITDALADPPGVSDQWHGERLMRLEGGFLCYEPPSDAPALAPRPSPRPVTFGSFNNLSKVHDAVIETWAALLSSVPDSRLLLKSRQLADATVRRRILAAFARGGVAEDRIELKGRIASRADHLAAYGAVDVALDTFPYNGTTTTCEALWMGVPVVTLAGARHAGRVGASLLGHAGLGDWVARDPAEYVAIARRLASEKPDPATIRERLRTSPVMDAAGFTRLLEGALREAWRARCRREPR